MNTLYHYFTKMTVCLRLWGIIILMIGMNFHSVYGKEPANTDSKTPAGGKGKIMMMKLSTESPEIKAYPIVHIPTRPPASANNQLKNSSNRPSRQAGAVIAHSQQAEIKPIPPKTDKIPSVDAPVSSAVSAQQAGEKIGPTTEHQENSVPRLRMANEAPTPVTGPSPRQSTVNEKELNDIKTINLDTLKTSNSSGLELNSKKEPIQDKIAIITRLLLKFSLITVCCITLFFSFSALQMAKSNR